MTQQHHEARKKRFEELVAALYEFDHWLQATRDRDAFGIDNGIRETASPFSKVQSISSVYFPQFSTLIDELDKAASQSLFSIYEAQERRLSKLPLPTNEQLAEANIAYLHERNALLDALKKFAHQEFQ